MKRGRKTKQFSSIESILLHELKGGQSFYSDKQDKDITAVASYYKINVKTERFICLHPITLEANRIIRVTILKTNKES